MGDLEFFVYFLDACLAVDIAQEKEIKKYIFATILRNY